MKRKSFFYFICFFFLLGSLNHLYSSDWGSSIMRNNNIEIIHSSLIPESIFPTQGQHVFEVYSLTNILKDTFYQYIQKFHKSKAYYILHDFYPVVSKVYANLLFLRQNIPFYTSPLTFIESYFLFRSFQESLVDYRVLQIVRFNPENIDLPKMYIDDNQILTPQTNKISNPPDQRPMAITTYIIKALLPLFFPES